MPAAHEPTDEDREMVEAMAAFGVPQADIARVLRLSENTLRKHYPDELGLGATKATTKVAGNLYRMATGTGREAVTAAIFWMKTRAGWKETSVHEHTGKDGTPLTPTIVYGNHPAPAVAQSQGDEDADGHTIQ